MRIKRERRRWRVRSRKGEKGEDQDQGRARHGRQKARGASQESEEGRRIQEAETGNVARRASPPRLSALSLLFTPE